MYLAGRSCILVGMHSGERWRLGHRPALNGLRGIAVGLVLLTHIGTPYAGELGATGVAMFFALSGFLITALLLEERTKTGRVSVPRFYLRRAARLGPALLVCVALALIIEAVVEGRIEDWSLALGALTWSSNLVMAHAGWDNWAVTPLSHTWSLAVEEQFYIVWPLLLGVLVRLRRTAAVTVLLYLAAGSVIIQSTAGFEHAYLLLDARASQLIFGAVLAFMLVGSRARPAASWWSVPPLVAILAVGMLSNGQPAESVVVALLTVGVLYVAAQTPIRMLELPPAVWVGERAYGIYLYHRPLGFLVDHVVSAPWWVTGMVTAGLTLVVAALSYRLVEEPVRALVRDRGRTERQLSGWIAVPSHQPAVRPSIG